MLEANEDLVQKVRENMIVPEGFIAEVMICEEQNNDRYKSLAFSFRKKGSAPPKKELFDFGILFFRPGDEDKDLGSYISAVNAVLEQKARLWENLIEARKARKTVRKR